MFWLIVAFLVGYFIYLKAIKPLNFWKERNVPYSPPLPILGNMGQMVLRKKSFLDLSKEFYMEFRDERYSGTFQFTRPLLIIRDLELIKQITVKDFDYFTDHLTIIPADIDPLMGKNLIALKGQRWRDMRATLSPSFTSSKMRQMFELLSEASDKLTNHFLEKDQDLMELEMKDVFSRFTNDAIASTAFGTECDSLKQRENEFYVKGKQAATLGGIATILFFLYSSIPNVMKESLFKIPLFSEDVKNFFRYLVTETIEYREKNNIHRPDMIQLLMEAKNGKLKYEEDSTASTQTGFATVEESHIGKKNKTFKAPKEGFTDLDMTAQVLIFFFGGFETSSSLMCCLAHELAENPDVQKKLQKEIDETMKKCNGKITYETLLEMKYLDMVMSEVLRKWPVVFQLDRECVKTYTIPPEHPKQKPLVIEKGQVIIVPVYGIHHDPIYFPNPEIFDPERFSDENKSNILPGTYFPFGSGPRNCIGSRFALLENKLLFFKLLSKFNLTMTKKTVTPLKMSPKSLNLTPDGGYWLGLQKR